MESSSIGSSESVRVTSSSIGTTKALADDTVVRLALTSSSDGRPVFTETIEGCSLERKLYVLLNGLCQGI